MRKRRETEALPRLQKRVEDALEESHVVTLVGASYLGKADLARQVLSRTGREFAEHVLDVRSAIECEAEMLLLRTSLSSAESHEALARWLSGNEERRAVVCARSPLYMPEEQVIAVKPIPVGAADFDKGALENEASRMLYDEALRLRDDAEPSLHSLVALAKAVDGIPGLLMSIARSAATFGHDEVLRRIRDDLRFIDVDGALNARLLVEWNRLEAEEQRVFAAASVFRGGFTFECAKAVLGVEAMTHLARLSEFSLLDFDQKSARFVVLRHHREFATAHAAEEAVRRHGAYFAAEATRHVAAYQRGEGPSLAWLLAERENLEAVARRGGDDSPMAVWAVVIAASFGGRMPDAIDLFDSVANANTEAMPVGAWLSYAEGLQTLGRFDLAQAALDRSEDNVARALVAARIAHGRGRGVEAVVAAQDALHRAEGAGDEFASIGAWTAVGQAYERTGQYKEARAALEQAVKLARAYGDLRALSAANLALSEYFLEPETLPDARVCVMEADAANVELGNECGRAIAAGILGLVDHVAGDLQGAAAGYLRARSLFLRTGMLKNAALALGYQGLVDLEQKRPAAEPRLLEAIAELTAMNESYYRALFVGFLGGLHARGGATQHAEALLKEAEEVAMSLKSKPLQLHAEVQRVHIGHSQGLSPGAAARLKEITRGATKFLDLAISLRTHQWRNISIEATGSFRVGYAFPVDLSRKPLLGRTVLALAAHHAHQRSDTLGVEELAEQMWPDERMSVSARRNRVRVTIANLRQLGLADVLQTQGSGYRFNADWKVSVARD